MSKFPVEEKISFINKWRHRCDMLNNRGLKSCPKVCQPCDEIAAEICEDLKEVAAMRGFQVEKKHGD